MRRNVRQLCLCALLFGLAGGALACGPDITDEEPPPEEPEPVDPPGEGQLLHENEECQDQQGSTCSVTYEVNTTEQLQAKVLSANQEPAADVLVNYEIETGDEFVTLGSRTKLTNQSGVASVELRMAEDSTGSARVSATTDNEELGTLEWRIEVTPENAARYEVTVTYGGEQNVRTTDVGLYDGEKDCSQLRSSWAARRSSDGSAADLPTAVATKEAELQLSDDDASTATVNFVQSVSQGERYTVWAQGFKKKQSNEPEVELAAGCASGGEITSSEPVTVDVEMIDHVPLLRESYSVTHYFNLIEALPDTARSWVYRLALLVRSPGAFIVGCDADSTYEIGGSEEKLCPHLESGESMDGIVDILIGFLPDDNSIVDQLETIKDNDLLTEETRRVIDSIVFEQLDKVGFAEAGRKIARDIFDSFQRFGVRGPMQFEPDKLEPTYENGEPVMEIAQEDGAASQRWQEFSFYWQQGQNCEDSPNKAECRTTWFNVQDLMENQESPIQGNFGATLGGTNSLHIEEHNLELRFGALLLGVIQRVVLPRYFAGDDAVADFDTDPENGVVTFEELLQNTIVDCEGIANQVGDSDTVKNAVKRVCEDLRSELVDRLETAIVDQLSIDEDTLTVSSPDGEPCTLYQPATYPMDWENKPLPYINRFGKEEQGSRCTWDLSFSFSGNTVPGTFYGSLQ